MKKVFLHWISKRNNNKKGYKMMSNEKMRVLTTQITLKAQTNNQMKDRTS